MVTTKERSIQTEVHRGSGRLSERVEQDLAEALDEFGAPARVAEPAKESGIATPAPAPEMTFGYGIPMAGVRYYEFAPGA